MLARNGLAEIAIKNFRALNGEFAFEFAPVTILTGTNSSGKSSITKALLLLKSMIGSKVKNENPFFNFYHLGIDDELNLGSFDFWINSRQKDDKTLTFTFPFYFINVLNEYSIEFTYGKQKSAISGGQLERIRIYNKDTKADLFVVDQTEFRFDFVGLWKGIEDFHKLTDRIGIFIDKVENRYNEFALSWENESGGESDLTSNVVRYFLMGFTDSYKSLDNIETCTYEMFVELLTDGELEEFSHLKQTIFLSKAWKFHARENSKSLLKFNQIINPDYPLFTYDIVNKPGENENTDSLFSASPNAKEYSNKLKSSKNIQLTDDHKKHLKAIQKAELITLNNIMFDERHVLGPLNHFVGNKLEYYFTNIFTRTILKPIVPNLDSDFDRLYFENDFISKFEKEMMERQSEPNLFSGSWVLRGENEKDFCTAYGYHPNKNYFLDVVVLGSIQNNIDAIISSFQGLEFIPATRNPMADRYYSPKEKNNYFSRTIANLLRSDSWILTETIKNINGLIVQFGVGERFELTHSEDGSNINVLLVDKNQKQINLADYGNGINQLIPVILKIGLTIALYMQHMAENATTANGEKYLPRPVIIIEEPETGLHPSLQSKLADAMVEWSKYVTLIVETHSEYLIRRMQGIVVEGKAAAERIKIYYFHNPLNVPEGESQVYPIEIDFDGGLSKNFGKGFLDEASNLNIALYHYTKEQHN